MVAVEAARPARSAAPPKDAGAEKAAKVGRTEDRAPDREKEKEKERPAAVVAEAAARPRHANPPRGGEGLPEEVLTQIAQAKFEAQEEKLRDVARFAVALLRDFTKLSAADCTKRVAEVQKALLKYEMQCLPCIQEKRRRVEIVRLEEQAETCRKEAEEEGEKIVELRQVLELERRRRKRYEGYEEAAAKVNRMRTRADSQAAIQATTEDIARLRERRREHEALVEERTQRAQVLRQAVAELAADLKREQDLTCEVLESSVPVAADLAEHPVVAPDSDLVEVIS